MKLSLAMWMMLMMMGCGNKAYAHDGGVDGGGGGGVRCVLADGSTTLETLDIHEAKLRGVSFSAHPAGKTEIADYIARVGTAHYWNPLWGISDSEYADRLKSSAINPILNGQSFVEPFYNENISLVKVATLPLSNDYGSYSIRPNCRLEQIAFFDDVKKTLSFANNFSELDGLNQAALLIHEISFFENRKEGLEYAGTNTSGSISSERSRQFVSSLLSDTGLKPHYDGLEAGNYTICITYNQNTSSTFFLYNSSPTEVTVVFNTLSNRYSEFSTRAVLSGIQMEDLTSKSPKTGEFTTKIILDGELNAPDFSVNLIKNDSGGIEAIYSLTSQGSSTPIGDKELGSCGGWAAQPPQAKNY